MCQLTSLSEDAVLDNLNKRFKKKHIYTSTTAKVLIAVNPYVAVPENEKEETMEKYQRAPVNLEGNSPSHPCASWIAY